MVDLASVEAAREGAVTGKTHEDQAGAFRRFREYLDSGGIVDYYFLEDFTKGLRNGRFSGPSHDTLVEDTIRGAVSYVASTFRENDRLNPTKDEDSELDRLLSRQYRAFRNEDPPVVHQKAVPVYVFWDLLKNKHTKTKKAIGQLGGPSFFFANISCEYLKIPQSEKRRTYILRLRNIRFFRRARILGHLDPQLEYANCVSK
jgi:hypothetical protein